MAVFVIASVLSLFLPLLFVFCPASALLPHHPPPAGLDPCCEQPHIFQGCGWLLFACQSFQDLSLLTTKTQLDFNSVGFNVLPEKTGAG